MEPWIIISLLGLAIIVYAKIFSPDSAASSYKKIVTEMEESLDHFALELEAENKQLLEYMAKLKQDHKDDQAKLMERIERLERQTMEQAAISAAYQQSAPMLQQEAVTLEKPPEEKQKSGMEIKRRYTDLFELHDQGKSMEYIAKKLDMNKGEVQLILQLAEQEEQLRV